MYHSPKYQKYPERHFLDQPQRMTHKLEVNVPHVIKMDLPEGQFDKEIETNFPYQE